MSEGNTGVLDFGQCGLPPGTAEAIQAMFSAGLCVPSMPGCAGGRTPAYAEVVLAAGADGVLSFLPNQPIQPAGILLMDRAAFIAAGIITVAWKYNGVSPWVQPSQLAGASSSIVENPPLEDFDLEALRAGINFMPTSIKLVSQATALNITLNNPSGAPVGVRAWLLGTRPN
jgi:hypothetical protein